MTASIWDILVPVIIAVLGSSGLWAFITSRRDRKSAKTKMLIGLGHDRIISLGTFYIERGNISTVEFDDFNKYLYEPYKKLGGNGSAERLMEMVKRLPPPPHNAKQTDEEET